MGKLMIEGNCLYEIDEDCMREKMRKEKFQKDRTLVQKQSTAESEGKNQKRKTVF